MSKELVTEKGICPSCSHLEGRLCQKTMIRFKADESFFSECNYFDPKEVKSLTLDQIRRDGGTQPRVAINQTIVEEYADDLREGAVFPPVLLFNDGTDHWLVDGYHRVLAAEMIGLTEIAAEVRQGTRRDAVLYSCGANATHGLRRTNADKRRAVLRLLEDSEWSKWSDREIARRCGLRTHL